MSAALQARALRDFYRDMTHATPGGVVLERDGGLLAAIVDNAPDRSIPNAVVYDEGDALLDSLDDLADAYADAGVRAWTVWARPGHDDVAAALRDAGHELDGEPSLMVGTLAAMDLEPRAELDLVRRPEWRTVGEINDAAWGHGADEGFAALLDPVDPGFASRYVARVDGAPAASVVTSARDGHVMVWLVATDPAYRGRGLCGELMRTALRDAREAGATTTSLEGSAMGTPIYERLGYETIGRLALYERRVRR